MSRTFKDARAFREGKRTRDGRPSEPRPLKTRNALHNELRKEVKAWRVS